MTRTRDLDFTPLSRRGGLSARLRAASANNRLVIGGTVAAVLVIGALVVLVGLVATGNATDVGGLVLLVMVLGGGLYALFDVMGQAGGGDSLDRFARANDLTVVRGSMVPDYAGSHFADESHVVNHSVRTKRIEFVEVGDRFPTGPPPRTYEPHRPQLFLRARLPGPVTCDPVEAGLVPRELDEALAGFAGPYLLEVSGDELTVFGSRGLEAERAGRVEEAFALTDELVAHVGARAIPTSRESDPPSSEESLAVGSGTRGPLLVVGWTLALLIGVPLAIAVVMSTLDDFLLGDEPAARAVVSLIVLAVSVVVAWGVRTALTPRRSAKRTRPS